MDNALKEKQKYEAMWSRSEYRERSPGLRMAQMAYDWMNPEGTMIDLGCGTGRAAAFFAERDIDVTGFDIADNAMTDFDGKFISGCLWDMPDMPVFDYGFCADVMEHLPPEHIDDAFRCIHRVIDKEVFFQIALFECHMGDVIGEHLHLTVKPHKWWIDKLNLFFSKVEIKPHAKYVIARCIK